MKTLVTTVALLVLALDLFAQKTDDKGWTPLFDGKTLKGWKETDFAARSTSEVKDGKIVLGMGEYLTGVAYEGEIPKMDYEVRLEAMRVDGNDFFCGLTFPVGDAACTFVVGGWGGATVGISSINEMDASENETTKYIAFDKNRWYRIRVRVTGEKIEAWLDDDQIVDVKIKGKKISMRTGEIEKQLPFGISSFRTVAALRKIEVRRLDGKPIAPAK